jgi:hypothetical protein
MHVAKITCPFQSDCPYNQPCRDHSWLCIRMTWLIPVGSIGFVTYLFWQGWQGGMFN